MEKFKGTVLDEMTWNRELTHKEIWIISMSHLSRKKYLIEWWYVWFLALIYKFKKKLILWKYQLSTVFI